MLGEPTELGRADFPVQTRIRVVPCPDRHAGCARDRPSQLGRSIYVYVFDVVLGCRAPRPFTRSPKIMLHAVSIISGVQDDLGSRWLLMTKQ